MGLFGVYTKKGNTTSKRPLAVVQGKNMRSAVRTFARERGSSAPRNIRVFRVKVRKR